MSSSQALPMSSTSSVGDRIGRFLGYDDAITVDRYCDATVWFAPNFIYPNHWRPGNPRTVPIKLSNRYGWVAANRDRLVSRYAPSALLFLVIVLLVLLHW